MSGATALMDALRRHGVDTIFGCPGGAILPIYDALHIAESEGWVKHILVRHEQAGTQAADAYARATGKVGVCFGTSGPGATNLVTGIATAQMDSVPSDGRGRGGESHRGDRSMTLKIKGRKRPWLNQSNPRA